MSASTPIEINPPPARANQNVATTFVHLANRTAALAGNYKTFMVMVGVVLIWPISGPLFDFSPNLAIGY